MLEIRFRPRAQLDLDSAFTYTAIALDAPTAAKKLAEALYAGIERIADLPDSGMLFSAPELTQGYRRILVKNYWIYYTHDDTTLTVWRIFHTSRDVDDCTFVEL